MAIHFIALKLIISVANFKSAVNNFYARIDGKLYQIFFYPGYSLYNSTHAAEVFKHIIRVIYIQEFLKVDLILSFLSTYFTME